MSTLIELQAALNQAIAEDTKFTAGNNAAGTRARKALANVMKLAKQRRTEISEAKAAEKAEKAAA